MRKQEKMGVSLIWMSRVQKAGVEYSRISRNRGTLALRRSLIINSYLYDHPFPPHLPFPHHSSSSRVPGDSRSSVGLQISFLCRLIKLVWHISDCYHLISGSGLLGYSIFFLLPLPLSVQKTRAYFPLSTVVAKLLNSEWIFLLSIFCIFLPYCS